MNDGLEDLRRNLADRYNRDSIVSGVLMLTLVLMPIVFMLFSLWIDGDQYYITSYSEYTGYTVASVMEAFIILVITFSMYGRLVGHSERDIEWRESLISFAESKGADTSKLRIRHESIMKKEHFRMRVMLIVLLAVMVVLCYRAMTVDGYDSPERILMIFVPPVLGFFLTLPKNLFFPYRHEKRQIQFTEDLRNALRPCGIDVPAMPRVVKHRNLFTCLILLFITFGLYSFALMVIMFKSMNNHIRYQHEYEDRLLAHLEGRDGAFDYSTDENGLMNRERVMPKPLIIAQLFLIGMCGVYMTKLTGTTMDIRMGMVGTTIINDVDVELLFSKTMVLVDMLLMILAIVALIGIESGRLTSWRKVVRSCLFFLIPTLTAMFIYTGTSYTNMFRPSPALALVTVYGIVLMMVLSISIRRYYTPPGKEMPGISSWIRYVFYGELFPSDRKRTLRDLIERWLS